MQPETLYLYGDVTMQWAKIIREAVEDGDLGAIWLCSPGGDLHAALAIHDCLIGKEVDVIATGICASAAIPILLAGRNRFATPSTRFLIHDVEVEMNGTRASAVLQEISQAQKALVDLYTARTSMTRVRTLRLFAAASYFGVDEALTDGLLTGTWPAMKEAA